MTDTEQQTEQQRRAPRHPAQVTADRLVEHLDDLAEYLTPRDRDAIARVVATLGQIAEGTR